MNINSELTGINVYYTTHLTFILETILSTMHFWGYDTHFMGDGTKKAIKNKNRLSAFSNVPQDISTKDKLEKINIQINQKPETIIEHIYKMGLVSYFSLFEGFNKDYFQKLYVYKPEIMKTENKKVDYDFLFNFKDYKALIEAISQKEIEEFGYKNIDEIADLIRKKFNIDLEKNLKCWLDIRESYYRRNSIVHYDGKISEVYLQKLSLEKDKLDEPLINDIDYMWKCHDNLSTYMNFIDESIRKKFNLKSIIDSL